MTSMSPRSSPTLARYVPFDDHGMRPTSSSSPSRRRPCATSSATGGRGGHPEAAAVSPTGLVPARADVPGRIHRPFAQRARRASTLHSLRADARHRAQLLARRVEARDVAFAVFETRRWLALFFDGGLAQLEQHELALGVEAEADEPGTEQRHRLRDRRFERGHRRCALGVLVVESLEELLGLGREQRDLLLLDEHAQHGLALAGLNEKGALAGDPERARAERVDGI